MGVFNAQPKSNIKGDTGPCGPVGRQGKRGRRGPRGIGFKLTDDGNYDMQNKKIVNIATPTDMDDVVDYKFVRNVYVSKSSPSVSGNFDMNNNKIMNLKSPESNADAVTKLYTDTAFATKSDKSNTYLKDERIVLTDHLDCNYHALLNVQTAGDQDAINLYYAKTQFLNIAGSDFDAKNKKIINIVTDINNDTAAVNMWAMKHYHNNAPHTHEVTKDIDLKETYNVIQSKQQTFSYLTQHYNNLVSYNDCKNIFLSRREVSPMGADININNYRIFNLSKLPKFDHEVPNKEYVDTTVSTKADKSYVDTELVKKIDTGDAILIDGSNSMNANLDMKSHQIKNIGSPVDSDDVVSKKYTESEIDKLEKEYKAYVDQSHISDSGAEKDVFRYIMEDVNESSSEERVIVNGITHYSSSHHNFNKRAYDMFLIQANDNQYRSRISFNMYKLPLDYYTLCIELFVIDISQFQSINCVSTVLWITKQTTKKFSNYTRSIINFRKGVQTTPIYLDVDMHFSGDSSSPNQLPCYMIIYGITGTHSDVSPSVFDSAYFIENNKMIMQADLDMNNHDIVNSSVITQLQTKITQLETNLNNLKSKSVIIGFYQRDKGQRNGIVVFTNSKSNTAYINLGISVTIKKITMHVIQHDGAYISNEGSILNANLVLIVEH